MKFSELEDRAIRKIAKTDGAESFAIHRTPAGQRTGREKLKWFKEKNHLEENPILDFALIQIERAEERIRKAKTQNLPGTELKRLKNQLLQDLIKAVEKRKRDALETSLNKADEKRKEYEEREKSGSFPDTSREALRLEKLKLQHSFTAEDQALSRMAEAERSGKYDPLELLVLSGRTEKTFKRAAEIKEKIPEYLADNGGQLIGKIQQFSDSKEGQIQYSLKGSNGLQSVYIADLMEDKNTSPKIEDLDLK